MARATEALLSLCRKPRHAVEARLGSGSAENVNEAGRPGDVPLPLTVSRHFSVLGSPNTALSKSSCAGNNTSSVSSVVAPQPPPNAAATLLMEHAAFLISIGEMARHVSMQRKSTLRDEDYHGTRQGGDMEWSLQQGEAPLSVNTLVREEGQRVRLRFVPKTTSRQQSHQLKGNTHTNTAENGAESITRGSKNDRKIVSGDCWTAAVKYKQPVSLCTVLSCFAPPKKSYWQHDRLVEPYPGEYYGVDGQRHRGNKSDDNSATVRRDDGGTGSDVGDDGSCGLDMSDTGDSRSDFESCDGSECLPQRRGYIEKAMRSYGKLLTQVRGKNDPVFYNAFFLDTGNISCGERRKKMIALQSYRASVISFVGGKVQKKDKNNDFYVQHPELEIRGIQLTHLHEARNDLIWFVLEKSSPVELVTAAHANWYFERLVMRGMVGKRNRGRALAACLLLALKFLETGDIHKKIQYLKTLVRSDEAFTGLTWGQVQEWEFRAYVGLEFTLMPEKGNNVVEAHMERLLSIYNLTSQEYYSKNFKLSS
ncbi:cyclin dependent kinase-binding protein [Trypanosoma rangeli]|uniref:Cyclin dependent kinase-binding protein n=1 Tax=Trypanosoma rangeli TaxID=5698 RepID=A0A3R7NFS3_TRYRA|nr:cyclin dependent kinase-binding protein [Trypanosoma rangeli]RNF02064.1 cyclin dependent kinase-binding protein [Trypanosoma rangeli]|eukprot:RNF02064.1 cyclin dependent kinase-binding protein [Trypanosoma rangeli]